MAVRRWWNFDARHSSQQGRDPVVTNIWKGDEVSESAFEWQRRTFGIKAIAAAAGAQAELDRQLVVRNDGAKGRSSRKCFSSFVSSLRIFGASNCDSKI